VTAITTYVVRGVRSVAMTNRKLAMYLAGCAGAVLLVMAILSMTTGGTQEAHEHFAEPRAYTSSLVEKGGVLRTLFAVDIAFTILYVAFFAAFATYLRERKRPAVIVWLALGALVLTGLLDILEDHHILGMLNAAEQHVDPTVGAIAFQDVESACKFSVSFLGLALFGLAIPLDTWLGKALAVFLTPLTLLSAVLGYALPPESAAKIEGGRWIGFLLGFGLSIAWLRTQEDVVS
jgi:hypothetical protein